ncbi:MAG: bifunctional 5,10-methylenetetrahydrofolate dehydrogenase/5,10-methenyltetrahydrofolate cyclohydrolase [Lachnospiraceae bacterium]|nr:bifunctional 5,10-methylenetetrahydrofolate dehydrogenase/5,10-methenyltetrahydrofolate cyclohydrolase [Lachnospiraceae bacterium]
MELLKGKPVSDMIREAVMAQIKPEEGIVPRLAIVRVGEKPEDLAYEKSAAKKLTELGIDVVGCAMTDDITPEDFMKTFSEINGDKSIDGILVMRPLPGHLKEYEEWLALHIDPDKDVDGISPINLAGVMRGNPEAFAPCTAQAVIEILKGHGIQLQGKNVVLIGRSMVIGRPLSMLLLKENATVTICHTKTVDLPKICKAADIVIAAAGHAKLVTPEYVRDGQILVDVGINVGEDGNLTGDIDLCEIEKAGINVSATPVPGGIGIVTTSVLAKNVCLSKTRHMM